MSRTALSPKTLILSAGALLVLGGAGVSYLATQDNTAGQKNKTNNTPSLNEQTTYVTYKGQDGKNALELLKAKEDIQTKSSSLGNYVTAINGNDGGGTKYWTFYVNGQMSNIGAEAYVTKSSDTIEWKLQ